MTRVTQCVPSVEHVLLFLREHLTTLSVFVRLFIFVCVCLYVCWARVAQTLVFCVDLFQI